MKSKDNYIFDDIKSSSNIQINNILDFINNNFVHRNDKISCFKNYRLLIEYLNYNKYVINDLDADILLANSNELRCMVKYIIDEKVNSCELIDSLVFVYKNEIDNDYDYDINNKDINLLKLYYNEIRNYKVLSKDEERELFEKYKQGDMDAYDKLIKHNLKLVVKVCSNNYKGYMDFEDLLQEGNIILMKVIDKFDINQGYKFSTYFISCAKWYLEKVIKNKGRIIRLPIYLHDELIKFKKAMNDNLDILDKMNYKERVEFLSNVTNFSKKKIYELEKYLYDVDSYDKKVLYDEDETISSFLIDEDCCVEDEVINKINSSDLLDFLKNTPILTDNEKMVLYYRYVHRMKLSEIGKIMGVERETIRLREKKAFIKLKRNSIFKSLVSDEYLYMKKDNILKRKNNIV